MVERTQFKGGESENFRRNCTDWSSRLTGWHEFMVERDLDRGVKKNSSTLKAISPGPETGRSFVMKKIQFPAEIYGTPAFGDHRQGDNETTSGLIDRWNEQKLVSTIIRVFDCRTTQTSKAFPFCLLSSLHSAYLPPPPPKPSSIETAICCLYFE